MNLTSYLLLSLKHPEPKLKQTISLLEEGATIPFISRYRKEQTGGMDEVEIGEIRDGIKAYKEIIARQNTIVKAIEEQGQLTDELKSKITACFDATRLEDLLSLIHI